jgi:hypothetical protein
MMDMCGMLERWLVGITPTGAMVDTRHRTPTPLITRHRTPTPLITRHRTPTPLITRHRTPTPVLDLHITPFIILSHFLFDGMADDHVFTYFRWNYLHQHLSNHLTMEWIGMEEWISLEYSFVLENVVYP